MMQQNEIKIEPVNTWINGEVKNLPLIRFNYYSQYDFNNNPGYVAYSICEEYVAIDGLTYYRNIIDGIVNLPFELVENWGQDDTPIFDYVLQQLQLTRA